MRVTYLVIIQFKTAKLLSQVKDLEDSLNESMRGFGYHDKITITSDVPQEVSFNRELTAKELAQLEAIFNESYAEAGGKVKSITLQPPT